MPIVRVDDSGQEIERYRYLNKHRKKNAKKVAMIAGIGSLISVALFLFHSPEAGIFVGLLPVTLVSVVNLIDD